MLVVQSLLDPSDHLGLSNQNFFKFNSRWTNFVVQQLHDYRLATVGTKMLCATPCFHVKIIKTEISGFSWKQNHATTTINRNKIGTTSRLLDDQKIVARFTSTFPFIKLSATIAQESYNCCRNRIFSIPATTIAQQLFDHATVCCWAILCFRW